MGNSGPSNKKPASPESLPPDKMNAIRNAAPEESVALLRIMDATSRVHRHYELFLFLQGEIQRFIPHQILLSAWGNFHSSALKFDVISPLLGVRTGKLKGCGVELLLRDIYMRWIANGRDPLLLEGDAATSVTMSECFCSLHTAMRRMNSVLVHGVRSERDEIDSIYVAMNPESIVAGRGNENFAMLVEPLIAHIDVAFRKVAPLKLPLPLRADSGPRNAGRLSAREQEIMKWISEGRTNLQIAEIVGISSFTVKNHVQRIFRKLGATNRTEAVAKLRQQSMLPRTEVVATPEMLAAK